MGIPAIVMSEMMAEGEAAVKAHIHSICFKPITLIIRSNLDMYRYNQDGSTYIRHALTR